MLYLEVWCKDNDIFDCQSLIWEIALAFKSRQNDEKAVWVCVNKLIMGVEKLNWKNNSTGEMLKVWRISVMIMLNFKKEIRITRISYVFFQRTKNIYSANEWPFKFVNLTCKASQALLIDTFKISSGPKNVWQKWETVKLCVFCYLNSVCWLTPSSWKWRKYSSAFTWHLLLAPGWLLYQTERSHSWLKYRNESLFELVLAFTFFLNSSQFNLIIACHC